MSLTLKDMNGNTMTVGARVFTKRGKEGYVISIHTDTNKVRVKFPSNMIRKFLSYELERR